MKKERFYKIFKGLPEFEKSNVICVIDGEPYSWNVVKIELDGKTMMGKRMLQQVGSILGE